MFFEDKLTQNFFHFCGRKAEFALNFLKDAVKLERYTLLMIISNIAKMGSQIKALQTIVALFYIATESNNTMAIGSLIEIVEDNKVSIKVIIRSIKDLVDLILQGKDCAYRATPVKNQIIRNEYIETIIKISEQKPDILERQKKLLYKIANYNVPCSEQNKRTSIELFDKSFKAHI